MTSSRITRDYHILFLDMSFPDPILKRFIGWQAGFEPGHVKDSTAALLVCFSLFIFPSKPNFIRWVTGRRAELDQNNMPKPAATILQVYCK